MRRQTQQQGQEQDNNKTTAHVHVKLKPLLVHAVVQQWDRALQNRKTRHTGLRLDGISNFVCKKPKHLAASSHCKHVKTCLGLEGGKTNQ
jgi:hypothetical protein